MEFYKSRATEQELQQSQKALSRWDNEGGACPDKAQSDDHTMTNAELVHLRIRVIALENLVIALLAEGPERQVQIARKMASYIHPRVGFTQHPLTIKAADQMTDMIKRAGHFRAL